MDAWGDRAAVRRSRSDVPTDPAGGPDAKKMATEVLDKVEELFREQIASWPMLARGIENLRQARTRAVSINGYTVWIHHLPHRIASTTAAVDRESVSKRPCFLCTANLPPEEKGLDFNSELTIFCNPFPILGRHLTIVHREHRPQRISGQLDNMIALATALPGY